jgi:hypothetical protein
VLHRTIGRLDQPTSLCAGDEHAHLKDAAEGRQVVRNGSYPERTIRTGLEPIVVQKPMGEDRRPPEQREMFTPAVLPPNLSQTQKWVFMLVIAE